MVLPWIDEVPWIMPAMALMEPTAKYVAPDVRSATSVASVRIPRVVG